MAITNTQYNAIMREYDLRRNSAESDARDKKQRIYNTLPRVREIDDEISMAWRDAGMAHIRGNADAITEFNKKRQVLEAEKAEILRRDGKPADYMKPVYTCPLCNDTGYVGEGENTRKCRCLKAAIADVLFKQSNLPDNYTDISFENFDYKYYSPDFTMADGTSELETMQYNVRHAHEFVDTFPTKYQNMFFQGPVGCGKTYLSICTAKELLKKDYSVIYLTAADFFDKLKERDFAKIDDEEEREPDIIDTCDLLIIDDLGTENTTEYMSSNLFTCLNRRLNAHKAIIISSNLEVSDLQMRYSDRTYSRICGSFDFYRFSSIDIRKAQKL